MTTKRLQWIHMRHDNNDYNESIFSDTAQEIPRASRAHTQESSAFTRGHHSSDKTCAAHVGHLASLFAARGRLAAQWPASALGAPARRHTHIHTRASDAHACASYPTEASHATATRTHAKPRAHLILPSRPVPHRSLEEKFILTYHFLTNFVYTQKS